VDAAELTFRQVLIQTKVRSEVEAGSVSDPTSGSPPNHEGTGLTTN
jgi:hypothetical protein